MKHTIELSRENFTQAILSGLANMPEDEGKSEELLKRNPKLKKTYDVDPFTTGFTDRPIRVTFEVDPPEEICTHDNWQVKGNEFPAYCTCLDCGKKVSMCDAFNRLRDRMLEAIGEPECGLADLTPQRPATPDPKNYPDESEVK